MAYSALAATVAAGISSEVTKDTDLSTLKDTLSLTYNTSFSFGATAANKLNQLFHDSRTLTDAQTETLNFLAAGTMVDELGETMDLDELRLLIIKNTSAEASLIVGAAVAEPMPIFGVPATGTLLISPGGIFVYIAPDASGIDVSAAAQLKLVHDGTGVADLTYEIVVAGTN